MCVPLHYLKPYYYMNYVGDRWSGEATGGRANAFLCDVNADGARPAPSAFNLLCPAVSKASTC